MRWLLALLLLLPLAHAGDWIIVGQANVTTFTISELREMAMLCELAENSTPDRVQFERCLNNSQYLIIGEGVAQQAPVGYMPLFVSRTELQDPTNCPFDTYYDVEGATYINLTLCNLANERKMNASLIADNMRLKDEIDNPETGLKARLEKAEDASYPAILKFLGDSLDFIFLIGGGAIVILVWAKIKGKRAVVEPSYYSRTAEDAGITEKIRRAKDYLTGRLKR